MSRSMSRRIFAATRLISRRFAIALFVALIMLIGGRVVPSFTHTFLLQRRVAGRLPQKFGRFDALCMAVSIAALAGWVAAPDNKGGRPGADRRRPAQCRASGALGRRKDLRRGAGADPPCRLRLHSDRFHPERAGGLESGGLSERRAARLGGGRDRRHDHGGDDPGEPRPHRPRLAGGAGDKAGFTARSCWPPWRGSPPLWRRNGVSFCSMSRPSPGSPPSSALLWFTGAAMFRRAPLERCAKGAGSDAVAARSQ